MLGRDNALALFPLSRCDLSTGAAELSVAMLLPLFPAPHILPSIGPIER